MTGTIPGDEAVARAARTYGAAADHFCRPALAFWDRFGSESVARLGLEGGERVLDLCCGAGASAIPAAHAVGPRGRVVAVDVAAPLLELARARARQERLGNIEFRQLDATRTGFADSSFDDVICVFGVFFAADMPSFVAEMWRMVAPGGRLAITTWGPGLFEPANEMFWDGVREADPSLYKGFNPWDQITTPGALADLLRQAGTHDPWVEAIPGEHRLEDPGDFWDIVLGSGYRATVDSLAAAQRAELRERLVEQLRARAVQELRADTVVALARRT